MLKVIKGQIKPFTVDTDKLYVTDPCYREPTIVFTAKKGKWLGWTEVVAVICGERAATLTAMHIATEISDIRELGKIDNLEGSVGVDAGMVTICSAMEEWGGDSPIYNGFCRVASNEGGIIDGVGIVSSSGFGDGSYSVYALRDNEDKVFAVKIEFITEDDL